MTDNIQIRLLKLFLRLEIWLPPQIFSAWIGALWSQLSQQSFCASPNFFFLSQDLEFAHLNFLFTKFQFPLFYILVVLKVSLLMHVCMSLFVFVCNCWHIDQQVEPFDWLFPLLLWHRICFFPSFSLPANLAFSYWWKWILFYCSVAIVVGCNWVSSVAFHM